MTVSRRSFCLSAGAFVAASGLPASAFAFRRQDTQFRVDQLRDNVWVFSEGDRMAKNSGNAMLIATSAGPVLFDTKFAMMSDAFVRTVRKTAGAMPTLVINSHHHPDHTGGNFAFQNRADILAQRNLRPRLETLLNDRIRPSIRSQARALARTGKEDEGRTLLAMAERFTVADFAPNREFDEELEFDHGDVKIVARFFGNAHTDNDCAIFLPDLHIAHVGDLLFHRMHAFIDRSAEASTAGWQTALDGAAKFCDEKTIVVPGHGDITDHAAFAAQRTYFDQLREVVQQAIKEDMSRTDITRLKPSVFNALGNKNLQGKCFGAMYDELQAESP